MSKRNTFLKSGSSRVGAILVIPSLTLSIAATLQGCGSSDEVSTTETSISKSLSTSLKTSLVEDGYSESDATTIATAAETSADSAAASGVRVERAGAGKFAFRGKGLLRVERFRGARTDAVTGGTLTADQDIAVLAPAAIEGAMAAVDSTSVAEADKPALIAAIAEDLVLATSDHTDSLSDADAAIMMGDITASAVDGLGQEFLSAEMTAPVDAAIDGLTKGIPDSGISAAAIVSSVGEISEGALEGMDAAKVETADLPTVTEAATAALTEALDELEIPADKQEDAVAAVTEGALEGLKAFELSAADTSTTKSVFQDAVAAVAGGATKGIAGAGIKSADAAKFTKKIAFAAVASLKDADSAMTEGQIASFSQFVTKGIVSKAEKGGIAKADLAAAIAGAQEKVMAAFAELSLSQATIATGMEALNKGAAAGLGDLSGLTAAEQASMAETVASAPIAYLSNLNITDETIKASMITAATKGAVAGIPVSKYSAAELAEFSKSASKGAMKGVNSYMGSDASKVASFSTYISDGVTGGAAATGMDSTKIESFLTASSKATLEVAGTLGFSATNISTLSNNYTSRMTEGLSKFSFSDSSKIMDLSTKISAGATEGAAALSGLTEAEKKAIFSKITSAGLSGLGKAGSFSEAQLATANQQMLAGNLSAAKTGGMSASFVDDLKGTLSSAALEGTQAAISNMATTYGATVTYDASKYTAVNSTLLSSYDSTAGSLSSSYSYSAVVSTYVSTSSSSSAASSSSTTGSSSSSYSGGSSSSASATSTMGTAKVMITLPTSLAGRPCVAMLLTGSTLATAAKVGRVNLYGNYVMVPIAEVTPGTYRVRAFCQKTSDTALSLSSFAPTLGDFANAAAGTSITITAGQETAASVTLATSTTSTDF